MHAANPARHAARRLNAKKHRTANGALWTPRLVRFLLALMLNESGSSKAAGALNAGSLRPKSISSKVPAVSMGDKNEIAKRLSALGRVTMRPWYQN